MSIIMPCYQAENYVAQAIESVIAQTYLSWELIVVDDGSFDGSREIIEVFLSDKRIKYIGLDKNTGVANARNVGLEHAKGRYISFLDADDVWLKEKLEREIAFLLSNDIYVTCSSYYVINETGRIISQRQAKPRVTYNDMLKSNEIGNLTGIYDTLKFGKVYFKQMPHEDYIMWLAIIKKEKFVYTLPEYLAKYRVSRKSISANKFKTLIWQWRIYRYLGFNSICSGYYLVFYVWNGVKKNMFRILG